MESLWFNARSPYAGTFSVSHVFMPYMLPDVGLVLLIRVLGFDRAGPVWSTLTMLALAGAIWFYARQMLETRWAESAAVLCGLYIATNYLFISGFFSFQWGVASAFVAMGALEAWRRNRAWGWFGLYAVACFVCYGSHLACFAILGVIVGVLAILRKSWLELSPLALLTVYHLLVVPGHPVGGVTHNTVADKFGHFLEAMFVRQNYVVDRTILALFWGIIVVAIWRGKTTRKHWELAATCLVAASIYFVLPFSWGGVFYVDERALPFFYIPFVMLALRGSAPDWRITAACAVLAAANLVSLGLFLPRQNRELTQYREALAKIPAGKTVLPVYTRGRDGNTYPLRHAGAFYRSGYVPYLFSQVNASGPAGYFKDLSTIYRPPQNWYVDGGSVDWEVVGKTYDFVVVTRPWDARIKAMEVWYQNDVATVFSVGAN